jgi:hypothetical protein
MTVKNVIIGVSILGIGITVFCIYNGVIGSATKDLVKDISNETTNTTMDVSNKIMESLKAVELKNQEVIAQNLEIIKQHSELTLKLDAMNQAQDLNIVQIQKETLGLIQSNEIRIETIVDKINRINQKCVEYDDFNSTTLAQIRTITNRLNRVARAIMQMRAMMVHEE